MRPVRVPLRDGQPVGVIHGAEASWKIHAVRGRWTHPAPGKAKANQETTHWRFLVEGPALYPTGDQGFFEVVVREFAASDSLWMDTV